MPFSGGYVSSLEGTLPLRTSWCIQPIWKILSSNWIHFSPGRDEHKNCLKPPPSHGSVKNGCISNTSYRPSNTTAFSTSRIMGERVRCIEVETEYFSFQSIMSVVSMWVNTHYIPVLFRNISETKILKTSSLAAETIQKQILNIIFFLFIWVDCSLPITSKYLKWSWNVKWCWEVCSVIIASSFIFKRVNHGNHG